MLQRFAFDQVLWTGRLALLAVFLIWVKRSTVPLKPDPRVDARLELWMDLTLVLMGSSWATWLLMLCNTWSGIGGMAEAGELLGTGFASDQQVDAVRTAYRLGISFAHAALILLSLPVYIALRRRQDLYLRANL